MNYTLFPIGLVIGILVAAPVGPVNLICINRTFRHGPWQGFFVGISAAVGDALFALAAAGGLSELAQQLPFPRDLVRIVGGVITLGFAFIVWRSAPHLEDMKSPGKGLIRQSIASFTMTVTNPATLTAFVAFFAGFSLKNIGFSTGEESVNLLLLVAAVLFGSMLWWLALCHGAARLRDKISDRTLVIINHTTAIMLFLFGLLAIGAGFHN